MSNVHDPPAAFVFVFEMEHLSFYSFLKPFLLTTYGSHENKLVGTLKYLGDNK